jgi:predicted DNA-binding protein
MTVTLELRPEIESRLTEKARSLGKTVETLLIEVIEESINKNGEEIPFYETAADEEWIAELDSLTIFSDQIPETWDDSRENIYGERENKQI